jgi:hypothetical protein
MHKKPISCAARKPQSRGRTFKLGDAKKKKRGVIHVTVRHQPLEFDPEATGDRGIIAVIIL